MVFKRYISLLLLLILSSYVLCCEMDCRRGLSVDFAKFYSPVIRDTINSLQADLYESVGKVKIPNLMTEEIEKEELLDEIDESIHLALNGFYRMVVSEKRLAEGFYQVMFNEALPYKGDCNNPRRLTRKMPEPGGNWTLEECYKMDYRCGNPPSICYFLDDVKSRCLGRIRRQLTEYASLEDGSLARALVRSIRKAVYDTLANNGVAKLTEDNRVETYISRLVSNTLLVLDTWIENDVKNLCKKPSQDYLCNSWDDAIRLEILKWP